jgi:hypothetical protein
MHRVTSLRLIWFCHVAVVACGYGQAGFSFTFRRLLPAIQILRSLGMQYEPIA